MICLDILLEITTRTDIHTYRQTDRRDRIAIDYMHFATASHDKNEQYVSVPKAQ